MLKSRPFQSLLCLALGVTLGLVAATARFDPLSQAVAEPSVAPSCATRLRRQGLRPWDGSSASRWTAPSRSLGLVLRRRRGDRFKRRHGRRTHAADHLAGPALPSSVLAPRAAPSTAHGRNPFEPRRPTVASTPPSGSRT